MKRRSPIVKLKPFLHNGLLRVGGKHANASLSCDIKFSVIFPNKHHVTDIIIRDCHKKGGHQGDEHVFCSLRTSYWIIKGTTTVHKVNGECVKCCRYQMPVMQQQMPRLPDGRVYSGEPPFTSTGLDCFGPFYIRRS